eukprot:scaffold888_cov569-Prasinococcus_capsulatus_cf.AAC.11
MSRDRSCSRCLGACRTCAAPLAREARSGQPAQSEGPDERRGVNLGTRKLLRGVRRLVDVRMEFERLGAEGLLDRLGICAALHSKNLVVVQGRASPRHARVPPHAPTSTGVDGRSGQLPAAVHTRPGPERVCRCTAPGPTPHPPSNANLARRGQGRSVTVTGSGAEHVAGR